MRARRITMSGWKYDYLHARNEADMLERVINDNANITNTQF